MKKCAAYKFNDTYISVVDPNPDPAKNERADKNTVCIYSYNFTDLNRPVNSGLCTEELSCDIDNGR